ncbi:hypothetical protein GYMLUDRAFT_237199 [Collybiopsis luxurians FD-317 M1]|nr:hypothetical protein GYMLUDRAFT_237199 [Collybiopsis luxurians FD-317 M1]
MSSVTAADTFYEDENNDLERALSEWDAFRRQFGGSVSSSEDSRGPLYEWLNLGTTQRLMDRLQRVLDSNPDDRTYHKKSLALLRYLSKSYKILPSSLMVNEITVEDRFPVAGGGFADIWRGSWNADSEVTVCIKVLRLVMEQDEEKRNKIRKQFLNEALVWRQLNHPNILPLLGVNMELFSPSFCLVSPWMKNRDIITYLKQNPRHNLSSVLYEIAAGMRYLHSRDPPFVHGDIRGGNILVTDDLHCCLADFGLTLVTPNSQVWTITSSFSNNINGTMRWLAPEYITLQDEPTPPNHASRDVYAFGCTVLEILTLNPPFRDQANDPSVLLMLMSGRRPARPQDVWYPDEIWDLTTRCWTQNVTDRPSATEICQVLEERLRSSSDVANASQLMPIVTVAQLETSVNPTLNSAGASGLREEIKSGDLHLLSLFQGPPDPITEVDKGTKTKNNTEGQGVVSASLPVRHRLDRSGGHPRSFSSSYAEDVQWQQNVFEETLESNFGETSPSVYQKLLWPQRMRKWATTLRAWQIQARKRK